MQYPPHRQYRAAGTIGDVTVHRVVRVEIAQDPAAAVQEHQQRQRVVNGWRVKAHRHAVRIKVSDRGELDADFQVKNFKHIVDHIDGDVRISYNHPEDPTLLCLSPKDQPSGFSVFHYMKAMVQR